MNMNIDTMLRRATVDLQWSLDNNNQDLQRRLVNAWSTAVSLNLINESLSPDLQKLHNDLKELLDTVDFDIAVQLFE